ncbi:hypothetical protein GCM10023200_57740 [Actinomycetospora chlora]|uniref:Uncharacterized protein n=1 Tax=Actinomycetospora chlora TaxID=663608 RepID=A0ABP9CN09_9PSEU
MFHRNLVAVRADGLLACPPWTSTPDDAGTATGPASPAAPPAARGTVRSARPGAPRALGPREHTTPAHVRADFVARRGG